EGVDFRVFFGKGVVTQARETFTILKQPLIKMKTV
ncbi:unnamed protein product, partial [Heterotrigona itama]